MTTCKTIHPARQQMMAKRGICKSIAMAAASLCLIVLITGCTSSAARFTEAGQGMSQGTVPRLTMQENESQHSIMAQSSGSAENSAETLTSSPTLSCNYYIEKEFMASIEDAGRRGDTDTGNGRIVGGITPHHLLAAKMIAGFFRELSGNPPKTIVVIGPNHKRRGFSGLQTSSHVWATPFGTLEADTETVKMLVGELKAEESDSVMQDEHSISALVPYIRYYMPDVRIVPILLHGNYSSADSLKLGKLLGKIAADDPGSISIIASVDFSHYLDADTAYEMDDITLKAIKNNDIPAISRMSNDNMDSPPSIITLLGAMDEAGAADPETAGHSNSSDITGSGYDNTTSYFTMFFKFNDK